MDRNDFLRLMALSTVATAFLEVRDTDDIDDEPTDGKMLWQLSPSEGWAMYAAPMKPEDMRYYEPVSIHFIP